jgi:signal peptidase I
MKKIFDATVSASLSLISPGLGQLRNGQFSKAILFFALEYLLVLVFIRVGLFLTFAGLGIALILGFGLLLYIIFDAFYHAYRFQSHRMKKYQKWYIYITIILVNFLVSGQFKSYINSNVIQAHRVPTVSMEPTLCVGDFFIADYQYFQNNPVKPGDLVILKFPKNPELKYIERCIAVSGQVIEIRNKVVFTNGTRFPDTMHTQYVDQKIYPKDFADPQMAPNGAGNRDNYGPVTIPIGYCFVLGDNRDNSYDSRYWGFIPLELIVAKPLYIYWARNKDRIGMSFD